MDEILFRGKRTDDGKWVYGSPLTFFDGLAVIVEKYATVAIPKPDIMTTKCVPVERNTIGFYIGLRDKNDTPIFEGDIISVEKGRVQEYLFVVKFGNCGGVQNTEHPVGYVGFFFDGADAYTKGFMKYGRRDDIVYYLNEYECRVVGNIYDGEIDV